ncbi:carbohydrate-binding domain-containing protein [Maribellus sediminis]|uniref:carbohydrate-binding domain-containing protein n=1 Tax=Maribellus sediminis TaxID=2696285 RepID=UPI001430AB09|nr:carbohydrate-binding domain-containing protein [Maribellus sediminis]
MKRYWYLGLTSGLIMLMACNGLTPDVENEDDGDDQQEQVINEENIDDALAGNSGTHDEDADYVWDSGSVVDIQLNGSSVEENSDNVSVNGGEILISAAGNYRFTGTLNDGQILVDNEDEEIVRLILNGAEITSSSSAPIYVRSAAKVLIYLAENTVNKLTDSSNYSYDNTEDKEPNATIFSKADLTLAGSGSLTIDANFNDAINTKDGLIISGGSYLIDAADDGIRGKDYLVVKGGTFDITSGGDGLKSDNESDDTKGYIEIIDGNLDITAKGDGVAAETDLMVVYGEFVIKTAGSASSSSSKGLKSGVNQIIDDGIFLLNCTDDALHSNGTITINSGTFEISSGDDGIHADYDLVINDGDINIIKSYEGIESGDGNIAINKGTIRLKSSDDGLNLAGGGDMMGGGGPGGWGGSSSSSGNYYVYINGGYIYINASGDGLDANGSVSMTGGTLLIDGPTNNGNGALDYNNSFDITGGLCIAAGSSGMAQAPESSSDQYSVLARFSSTMSGGTLFHVQAGDGTDIFTYKPSKSYQSVAFSAPELTKGTKYEVYTGGSSTGDETDGLYSGGTYTPGTLFSSFTISAIVTDL